MEKTKKQSRPHMSELRKRMDRQQQIHKRRKNVPENLRQKEHRAKKYLRNILIILLVGLYVYMITTTIHNIKEILR